MTLDFLIDWIFWICSALIDYVNRPEVENWKGYFYAVILTLTAIIQTIFLSQYFQRMLVVGLQVRTAITATVYRKVSSLL